MIRQRFSPGQAGLALSLICLLLVVGCPEPFGNFDNPYDEESPDYQGYPAVDDPDDIRPVTPDVDGILFVPRLTALTIAGADSYEFQVSADPAFTDPGFTLVSTGNISPIAGWPALQAGTTYYWRARAHEGTSWGSWTSTQASFSLAVPSFSGTSPGGDQSTSDTTPAFDWADLAGATAYRFQLASDSQFTDIVDSAGSLLSSSYTMTTVLANDTEYHWRLGAMNADGVWTAWSDASSFTVSWNPQITGMSPADGESTNDTTPAFDWADVDGATAYRFQLTLDTDTLFANVIDEADSLPASSYTVTTVLSNGTQYLWRLAARNVDGVWTAWSAASSFTIDLDKPALLYPSEGASTTDTTPAFGWTNVAGASVYRLQVAGSDSFDGGSILVDLPDLVLPGLLPDGYELTQTLPEGSWYYWRVAASVDGIWSSWTATDRKSVV